MNLAARATTLRELMDDPHADGARLAATLRRFDLVNRAVSGWGTVYRRVLRPHLTTLGRPARILDLGCGGGDVLARIHAWAEADGFDVASVGVDPDARAIAVAHPRARAGLSFRCTDSATLVSEGERFDVVVSNHVLHHLAPAELAAFASDSLDLSRGIVAHGDIERGRVAYALYGIGVLPLAAGTFLRVDGLRSIRRSYRSDELAAALGSPWLVHRPSPFRLLAVGAGHG